LKNNETGWKSAGKSAVKEREKGQFSQRPGSRTKEIETNKGGGQVH